MEFRGHKKVHITSVGFEIGRVVQPIREIGADKVVVIRNVREQGVYREMIDEVERQLRKFLPKDAIEEVGVNIFDMADLVAAIGQVIRREQAQGNTTFLNVSVGTRLFAAAGQLAAMMFGAVAFYAEVEGYRTDPNAFRDAKGRPLGISKDLKRIIELPGFRLEPPEPRVLVVLDLLRQRGGGANQKVLILALEKTSVMKDVREDGGNTVSKRAYAEFRRRFLEPLLDRGWIEKHGARRNAELHMTPRGAEVLRMFGHLTQTRSAV